MPNIGLRELIEKLLGAATYTRVNNVSSMVGVAAAELIRHNSGRVAFLVVNLSANEVYLGPFPDVSTTKGIRLSPAGGSASYLYSEDFDVVGWAWYAIATGAASSVLVIEHIVTGGKSDA